MNFQITTPLLVLKVIDENYSNDVLDFYKRNKLFFEKYEPERPSNFYTPDYQKVSLHFEYQEILKGKSLRYWLYLKEDPDKIIGTLNLQNIIRGAFQSCMIGYKIDFLSAGNGYMTEALTHLIPLVFEELGLHRIEAYVHPENKPSIALLSKLGFTMEGIAVQCIKLNNKWQDHLRYAIVNSTDKR